MQDKSDHLPLRVRLLTLRAGAATRANRGAPRIATATGARPLAAILTRAIAQCARLGC
jgi:hypothetical protein